MKIKEKSMLLEELSQKEYVSISGGDGITEFVFWAFGRLLRAHADAGVHSSYGYNPAGSVLQLR